MFRLAELTWPHLVPVNRPQNSSSQRLISSSSSGCVKGLILQIEEKQHLLPEDNEDHHPSIARSTSPIAGRLRISSEVERRPPTPVSRSTSPIAHKMTSFWNGRQSRVGSPVSRQKRLESSESSESQESLASVTTMMSSRTAHGPYSLLPTQSEIFSDYNGTPFTPQAPRLPKVSQDMDSAADNISNDDETPLEIAQLQFGNRKSFNSGVRDLVQETPDTPIGGLAMERSFSPDCLEKGHLEAQQDNISTSYFLNFTDNEQKRPLNNRSNFSDPVNAVSIRDARSPLTRSDNSLPFLTAPHSPARGKKMYNHSNLSYDGSAGEGPSNATEVLDFAQVTGPHDLAECATESVDDVSGALGTAAAPVIMPGELIIDPKTGTGFITAPMPPDLANAATGALTVSAVPIDVTGQLPVPATPKSRKGSKRKRALKKGQKLVRKSRARLIRSPVLVIILGRQLGKPTAFALKQISKGVKLDDIAADTTTVPGAPMSTFVSVPE